MLTQQALHLFIARRATLTQRENGSPSVSDSSQAFGHEEVRLGTDSGREELVRLYFMRPVPDEYHEMQLVFRDSFVGLLYVEIIFTSRGEKEAFYNTHRMIRGISRLSIHEALHRLESLNRPTGKSKDLISEIFDPDRHSKSESLVAQIKSIDLGRVIPEMLNPFKQQPKKEETQIESDGSDADETFRTMEHTYRKDSDSFDPEDLEIEKFPQLNQDYANNQLELMSSGEDSLAESPRTIRGLYRDFFGRQYYLGKNSIDICPGDLILLYDNMGSVLKRNIGYSKFIMQKNTELEDRVRLMEQRNRMLSRELQSVSEKWKREGKLDISR